jgi:hypothetical protein
MLLGGLQQFISLATSFLGQQRIATGDQPLAWVGGMLYLRQIVLVQQRQLPGTALHQLLDLDRLKR